VTLLYVLSIQQNAVCSRQTCLSGKHVLVENLSCLWLGNMCQLKHVRETHVLDGNNVLGSCSSWSSNMSRALKNMSEVERCPRENMCLAWFSSKTCPGAQNMCWRPKHVAEHVPAENMSCRARKHVPNVCCETCPPTQSSNMSPGVRRTRVGADGAARWTPGLS
jgi:hypothetical protein